jgi:hypothetical protein
MNTLKTLIAVAALLMSAGAVHAADPVDAITVSGLLHTPEFSSTSANSAPFAIVITRVEAINAANCANHLPTCMARPSTEWTRYTNLLTNNLNSTAKLPLSDRNCLWQVFAEVNSKYHEATKRGQYQAMPVGKNFENFIFSACKITDADAETARIYLAHSA